ncbi:MAG TPA: aminotransferase class V-fold PLP-dependent enzyme [Thermoplasmata archaeon]|nr:aminotransferase class V-fold PLP-dependent enzyme [Thermoplasmata archaeon]
MVWDSSRVAWVRRQFPSVAADPAGRRRAFLDNGAGTLVVRAAAERESRARMDWSANTGNVFPESQGAEATILAGREAVSDFLNAGEPETIVSGESATSLLFSLSYALGRTCTGSENVVMTAYEHFANVSPWEELARTGRIREVRFADFDAETFLLDVDDLAARVDRNTKVVAVSAASNFLGTRSPLTELARIAHEVGALLIVDAVHHVCHGPTDVRAAGADALVFSGYKLFSRHGSFLYLRPDLVEGLWPYKVDPSPQHGPEKWEWGTRDQALFAAITGAIDYLASLSAPGAKSAAKPGAQRQARLRKGMQAIEDYEVSLSRLVLEGDGQVPGILEVPGLTLYGPKKIPAGIGRDPTFTLKLQGYPDSELSRILYETYGLAVGAEDYFSRVPRLYGLETALRATFVHYNTRSDASTFLRALHELARKRR